MKKIAKGIIACAAVGVLACGFAFAGCGGTTEYTITFDYNYDGAPSATTQTVEEGDTATKPADPTREGYTFNNWYTAASGGSVVDFSAGVYEDATYYAQWDVAEYTVSFVSNDTTISTETVVSGNSVSAPSNPTSEDGSVFSGWYADSACTESFDFSAPITSDTTVYAGWIEVEIPDGDIAVFFMTNDGTGSTYSIEYAEKYDKIFNVPTPAREGYRFMGWYTNEDGTGDKLSYGSDVSGENITVYASWYYGYVMEAEYTDLTDKYGNPREFFGYSNNYTGIAAILEDSSCSNGKYVQAGSQAGKYLIFEIESDTAVDDAYLTISASISYGYSTSATTLWDGDTIGSVSVSSSQYAITVFSEDDLEEGQYPAEYEGTPLSYDTMVFDVSGLTAANTHCAFLTYVIGNISLSAGTNYIKLLTTSEASNKSEGGQTTAKSPNLDCLTIYTSATLTQKIYQS